MHATQAESYRLGIDIGGTFTDLVFLSSAGRVLRRKVLSTPQDYARGILAGLQPPLPSPITTVVHGTTVATNTILEGKGAKTGLLTTAGFRDLLEIGRLRYPRLYDLTWAKPPPLVPRQLRGEVDERVDARGEVVRPLDLADARLVLQRLLAAGIESLAICLLHAYANPSHERRLEQLARELAPGLPISLSCDILPEIREYERTSTTAINAILQPVVGRYLATLTGVLSEALSTPQLPVYVMQSNGGVMSAAAAALKPIHIIESGPTAGVIGARALCAQAGVDHLLTLDMGGTTAKASLIEQGRLTHTPEYEVGAGISVGTRLNRGGGYPLRVPAIEIAEVGAGGGSIVRIDAGGSLRVGPDSAGARPGPACYGLGGMEPTLTDADLVLGYLNPTSLAGGSLQLDPEAARRALHQRVAAPLGLELEHAAFGVYRIAVANMARVARAVSIERGRDPRGALLCAFGGNGPLHAAGLAQWLGMTQLLIPPAPGLFSAFGLLVADIAHHRSRTFKQPLASLEWEQMQAAFAALRVDTLAELADADTPAEPVTWQYGVDIRYMGQSYELTVPLSHAEVGAGNNGVTPVAHLRQSLADRFGAEHQRTYGQESRADPIELVNLRVTAQIPQAPRAAGRDETESAAPVGPERDRRAFFGPEQGWIQVPVLASRHAIGTQWQAGPCLIEEADATTLVPPGAKVRQDEGGNLRIAL